MKSLLMILLKSEVVDIPQCKIQAHTSITFVTVKTPHRFVLNLPYHSQVATNWQIKANLFQLISNVLSIDDLIPF